MYPNRASVLQAEATREFIRGQPRCGNDEDFLSGYRLEELCTRLNAVV
jgi:hypothetical protein